MNNDKDDFKIPNKLSGSIPTREFNNIDAINYCFCLTKWQIIDVATSKVVFTSGRYSYGEHFYFNFTEDLGARIGSQYLLKAAVIAGSDPSADMIIQVNSVVPLTATFWLDGTTLNNTLKFKNTY